MKDAGRLDSPRGEWATAILIALVSLTTAVAVWWTSTTGSMADETSRAALIDAVKLQAAVNENWRKAYEEAAYAQRFAVLQAGTTALAESADPGSQARAANLQEYLLPNLRLLAAPLAVESKYAKPDGTYDIQKRFEDLQAETDLSRLDPEAGFKLADRLYSKQRWLVTGSVVLALSLFWLALAQISRTRRRVAAFIVGLSFFLLGLLWFAGVAVGFAVTGGGAL